MAILTGNVKSARVVEGKYKTGKRQGDEWAFLAFEVVDAVTGFVWSCQLNSEDGSYVNVAQTDLTGHKVRCKIASQSAGERELPDGRKFMQIRSQVRQLQDMGAVDLSE